MSAQRADLDAQHALAAEAGRRRSGRRSTPTSVEPLARPRRTRPRRSSAQSSRTGQPLAVDARPERLGERADDRADVLRRAPVAVVPPDPVARRDVVRGGAVLGEDPVDEVEPVDRAAVLAPAGDRR